MDLVHEFFYRKLASLFACFWTSVFTLFLALFGIFKGTIFRVKCDGSPPTNNLNSWELSSKSIDREAENNQEAATKVLAMDAIEFEDIKENDDLEEKDSPKFFFKFQYQTCREDYEPVASGAAPSKSINKYDFLSGRDYNHYLEEPQVVNLTVKELHTDSGEDLTRIEADISIKECSSLMGKSFDEDKSTLRDQLASRDGERFLFEKDFASDPDSESTSTSHGFTNRFVASTSDGLLTDTDFEDDFELDMSRDIQGEKVALIEEALESDDLHLDNLSTGYVAADFDEEDSDIVEELEQLINLHTCNSGHEFSEKLSEKHFRDSNNYRTEEHKYGLKDPDNPHSPSASDSKDSNELESLWEHQDFIEQLKMELKKARAMGLPTILREDESPKLMEVLKPWKIEETFHPEDRLCEVHKFYRSYGERMRKFDILNFQKVYAMGFLQSKDPLQSISSHKASAQTLTSLLSEKLLLCKRKKSDSDPMMNFIRDLYGDLETVYVGQMCLSWAILHWQYEKSLELWDSDHYGMHQYNKVAVEFQQFQVLLQRFIEHEPFEGPRVQNYVRKRCIMGNLLQVPVIREDGTKDKNAHRKEEDSYVVTSDMLVETIEESIRIFWKFVQAEKDSHDLVRKGGKGIQIEPTELELLSEVRTSLQKKEKKLKYILRSGNCILSKFRKHHHEGSSDQVLYFFSQVDMKLVSRVLNMSKLTSDQLLWCHHKLSKIDFVSRKIHVEPSFLLFPC